MPKLMKYDKFIELLKKLNEVLAEKNIFIDIKAIGVFAMIYWANQFNQSGRNASQDIDSLSKLDDEVVEIISLIGTREGVGENWLNNEWLIAKKGNEELEYFANWVKVTEYAFSNINLYILDLETLFFFKMRAIDDKIDKTDEPPRQQDVRDVWLILKIFDEHDIYNIKNSKMSSCINYFPCARDFMSGREP
jgi:hypothetical protein